MRFLLCMPRGCGFNDTMCQIWQSFQYALRTERELLIDTRFCGLADHLSYYVEPVTSTPNVPAQIDVSDVDWKALNQLTCYPPVFRGSLDLIGHRFITRSSANPAQFDPRFVSRIARMLNYLHRPSPELSPIRKWRYLWLRFRLIKRSPNLHCIDDRQESVVIHHRFGGGLDSLKALSLFRLNPSIREAVVQPLHQLGQDYDAVHFRHTDYKTDYESLIKSLQHKLVGRKVLVCSDNPRVIEYAKACLTESAVVCVVPLDALSPDIDTFRPAHYQWHLPLSERRRRNIAMLTDLIGMARAKNLYFGEVTSTSVMPTSMVRLLGHLFFPSKIPRNKTSTYVGTSGFAALADELRKQPDVLDRFVG